MARTRWTTKLCAKAKGRSASGKPSLPLREDPIPSSRDVTGTRFPYLWDEEALRRTRATFEAIQPLVGTERASRLRRAAERRTFNLTIVLEGLTDRGNVSAVLRTSEAMGIGSVHVIDAPAAVGKNGSRSSAGAEKWLHVQEWKDTRGCLSSLKQDGYRILSADARSTVSLDDLEVDQPLAFVLGHEHRGVSEEALSLSDGRVSIPMDGLVESLNVSVAAALLLGRARDLRRASGTHADLCQEQRDVLFSEYLIRHSWSKFSREGVEDIIRREISKQVK